MSRRFIVRPLAEADLENAARRYEEEQPGLAARFLGDVDRTLERVRQRPLQFPAVGDDVRRALLHTFPYAVYFRVSGEAKALFEKIITGPNWMPFGYIAAEAELARMRPGQ